MNDARLEACLDRHGKGDPEAVGDLVAACEPYLRMVVRRSLSGRARAKFDSVDVVQAVWIDLVRGLRAVPTRFHSAAHLRAYLVRSARNRLVDRLRRYRGALDAEQPLAGSGAGAVPAPGDRPSELAHAEDLWGTILNLCPPAHRGLLELRRQGLTFPEIAARTGLNEGSVRRILYDLARRYAAHADPTGAGAGTGGADGERIASARG